MLCLVVDAAESSIDTVEEGGRLLCALTKKHKQGYSSTVAAATPQPNHTRELAVEATA
jgi:hypothetical protein